MQMGDYMNKLPSSIGLLIHIVYYILSILSLFYTGIKSFDYWLHAIVLAIPITILYLFESIKAFKNNKNIFNTVKLIVIIISVPLFIFVGGTDATICSIIWNIYFFIIFVIEIISLFAKSTTKK